MITHDKREGTHQDHRVQLLALHRMPQESHHVPESISLGQHLTTEHRYVARLFVEKGFFSDLLLLFRSPLALSSKF